MRRIGSPVAVRGLVAAVVLTVPIAACGVPDDGLIAIEPSELPDSLHPSSTTTTAVSLEAHDGSGYTDVYCIRENQLVPEPIGFASTPSLERVVSILERGPGSADRTVPERSAVSQGEVIAALARDGERVTVELGPAFAEVAGADQVLALGQIVITLTSVPGVGSVALRQEGEPLDVPLPDGTLVRRPVVRDDYSSLIAPAEAGSAPATR